MPTLATFIQHSIGSPSQKIRQKKVIKSIQIGNKEIQLTLFADDMTLYIGTIQTPPKNLLELINKFSKIAVYKINVQKSVTFLCTINELSEREIKKTIPFPIAYKRIKYLGTSLRR